jgi:hypothetical protein
VVLVDAEYSACGRYPEPRDPALTKAHRVLLTGLLPDTTYRFYVASANAVGRLAPTYHPRNPGSFKTLVPDPALPFDYRLNANDPTPRQG